VRTPGARGSTASDPLLAERDLSSGGGCGGLGFLVPLGPGHQEAPDEDHQSPEVVLVQASDPPDQVSFERHLGYGDYPRPRARGRSGLGGHGPGPPVLRRPSPGHGEGLGVPVAELQEVRVEPSGEIADDHDAVAVSEADRHSRRPLTSRLGAPPHAGKAKSQRCDPQLPGLERVPWVTRLLPKKHEEASPGRPIAPGKTRRRPHSGGLPVQRAQKRTPKRPSGSPLRASSEYPTILSPRHRNTQVRTGVLSNFRQETMWTVAPTSTSS
jgi:hypothetical protein